MERYERYKYRLKTTPRIERLFAQHAGCARYVYNRAQAIQQERYKAGEKFLQYIDLCKLLTLWRSEPETAWLTESSATSQQRALKNLTQAYINFFQKRAEVPKLKKKGKSTDSFQFPITTAFDPVAGTLFVPRVGEVRYFNSREAKGKPVNASIYRDGGHWYIGISTIIDVDQPIHEKPGTAVGIDVGIVKFATLSTGEQIEGVNAERAVAPTLRRLQQSLERKTRLSSNWKEAKRKLGRLCRKVTNRRSDYLHKLTTTISKNHALVVVENLQVKNMMTSASGTTDKPGRKVRQKAGLNRRIVDQGWGTFRQQLDYKTERFGGKLVKVCAAYTSQTCSKCGHCDASNRQSQSKFACTVCGFVANADVNAANVILAAGQAVIASGVVTNSNVSTTLDSVIATKEESTNARRSNVKRTRVRHSAIQTLKL